MRSLCPLADVRTPYGMTEALPVCDVSVDEIDAAGAGVGGPATRLVDRVGHSTTTEVSWLSGSDSALTESDSCLT